MEELCLNLCSLFESKTIDLIELEKKLKELIQILSLAPSRFVDIDSSARDDHELFGQVYLNLTEVVADKQHRDLLFQLYQILNAYLGLKDKYAEAADWFLKKEFDSVLINN